MYFKTLNEPRHTDTSQQVSWIWQINAVINKGWLLVYIRTVHWVHKPWNSGGLKTIPRSPRTNTYHFTACRFFSSPYCIGISSKHWLQVRGHYSLCRKIYSEEWIVHFWLAFFLNGTTFWLHCSKIKYWLYFFLQNTKIEVVQNRFRKSLTVFVW